MKRLFLCLGAGLATAACSGGATSTGSSSTTGSVGPAASVDDAVAVRQFLDARYAAADVRHSFRTALGQDIDCIDFFAQPGVRALAARGQPITAIPKAPDLPASFHASEPAGAGSLGEGVAFDGSLDETGSPRSCPEGTVPEVRITVEQVQRAGGIEAFRKAVRRKGAPPRITKGGPDEYGDCEGDYDGYAHVVGSLLTPYPAPIVAGSSVMSIYGPTIPDVNAAGGLAAGDHSIAQTWMAGYTTDAACPECLQTVEVGWNVDNQLYGDDTNVPHLFTFSTADGYVTTGCYNDWAWAATGYYGPDGAIEEATCVPWVQVSNKYTPGMTLPASAVKAVNPRSPSTLPKELSLSTLQVAGGWWVLLQVSGGLPTLLGYYSGKVIDAPMSSYQVGGEVYDGTNTFAGAGVAMGSGQLPSEGQGYAAYHRDYFALVSGPLEGGSPLVNDAFVCSARSEFYSYSATPKPVSRAQGPWANYFYYGGDPPAATASAQ